MQMLTSIVMALVVASLLLMTIPAVTQLVNINHTMQADSGLTVAGEAADEQAFGLSLDSLESDQNPAGVLAAPSIDAVHTDVQIDYGSPFDFEWQAVPDAGFYQLQVASSSDFSTLIMNVEGRTEQAPADTLQPGTYYWRVRVIRGTQEGPWSSASRLTIVPQVWQLPIASMRPYAADSVWNTPIEPEPVYDPYSDQMVSTLGETRFGGRITSDTTQFTFPIYYADANTPRYNVPCLRWQCSIEVNGATVRSDIIEDVPIPDGAQPSAGDDAQLIVIDTVTGIEYGFFEVRQSPEGAWEASNGYRVALSGNGNPVDFGSRGAGVPYFAGLIRAWEIREGMINHAVAFAYEHTAARGCVYPATQTDGQSQLQFAMPEGARLQLNPALTDADFDRMGLSRAGKIVARALQQYGMVLVDTGGTPKIMAEDLSSNQFLPFDWYDADLGYHYDVISAIPYTEFRVLDLPDGYWQGARPNWGKCVR